MKRALVLMTVLGLALGGCGQSKLNPFNWFGKRPAPQPTTFLTPAVDPRGLVAQVLSVKVEPYPGGVIVRATGLPPTQGYWSASLVPQPVDDKGKLVFEFRIAPPLKPFPAGTQPSREVTVAGNVSDFTLQTVTSIEVQGANNALTAHR
jgi:hypothetical protein